MQFRTLVVIVFLLGVPVATADDTTHRQSVPTVDVDSTRYDDIFSRADLGATRMEPHVNEVKDINPYDALFTEALTGWRSTEMQKALAEIGSK